mgnify:CR=1 FL=1
MLTNLDDIKSDDVVVITIKYETTTYAMSNNNGASSAPAAVVVSVTGDKLSSAPADTLKSHVTSAESFKSIFHSNIHSIKQHPYGTISIPYE